MPEIEDELDRARQAGRREAEAFDGALRQAEQAAHEEQLRRLAREPSYGSLAAAFGPVWRLQQDVARLAAFHQAVLGSRAWRLIQWARRPFGRAW